MNYISIVWDDPHDPDGNVQHVAEHGLETEEVEHVIAEPTDEGISKSSDRPCVWGYTQGGDYIIVIYEQLDLDAIRVITAYEVPEPL